MITTDFIVIGSGIAGLSFAIKASKYGKVSIITKGKLSDSNTNLAQGGLAAVFSKKDNFELHIKDTLRAGDGLCNKEAVTILVKNAPNEIRWLIRQGVTFDKDGKKIALSKEAVHSMPRIVHAGDATGKEIESVLSKNARANKKIRICESHIAVELIKHNNECIGARVLDVKKNKITDFFSKATVLATGGIGRIYQKNTNPEIATGDGIAMAFNAGAEAQDMEFVQFHPTMLYGSKPAFLISETLRGEGGLLKNKFGETYMEKYHRDGDLAPRDVVSKFSVEEMKRTRSRFVYLDVRHLGTMYLKKRFPSIYKKCLTYKIDIARQMIPVAPAAHYLCGGIKTDMNGRTNILNLYAVGECACTGVHGADRLASNSLVEGLVFSSRVVDYLKCRKDKSIIKKLKPMKIIKFNKKNHENKLQRLMWRRAGITRKVRGLKIALNGIRKLENKAKKEGINKDLIEIKNMALVSKLVLTAALRRKESRGTHFIDDYPKRDDRNWLRHMRLNKNNL